MIIRVAKLETSFLPRAFVEARNEHRLAKYEHAYVESRFT